jgi:hypothetical protein
LISFSGVHISQAGGHNSRVAERSAKHADIAEENRALTYKKKAPTTLRMSAQKGQ